MNQKPSNAFIAASWVALLAGVVSYNVGLWNACMLLNEKGFYGMSFALSLFAAIVVQKNVRDMHKTKHEPQMSMKDILNS